MGGFCSRSSTVDHAPSGSFSLVNCEHSGGSTVVYQSGESMTKTIGDSASSPVRECKLVKQLQQEPFLFPELDAGLIGITHHIMNDGIPHFSRALSNKSRSTKSRQAVVAKEVSTLLGKAGNAGLDVLDTLDSSMSSLNMSSGFVSGVTIKGNMISILSFEVANTIVKGCNLMQSLSKENIVHLKEVVLPSEGVQLLISKDIDELLRTAAADKREDWKN